MIISAIENIEAKIVLELNRLIVLTMLPIAMGSRLQSSSMAMTMVVVMMWGRCGSTSWSCMERMVLGVVSVGLMGGSLFWGLFLLLIKGCNEWTRVLEIGRAHV